MHIDLFDPRDILWEVDGPAYRVHLWSGGRTHCTSYRLSDAPSVRAVLAWADQQVAEGGEHHGGTAEVWVEVTDRRDGLGVLRLDGTPT